MIWVPNPCSSLSLSARMFDRQEKRMPNYCLMCFEMGSCVPIIADWNKITQMRILFMRTWIQERRGISRDQMRGHRFRASIFTEKKIWDQRGNDLRSNIQERMQQNWSKNCTPISCDSSFGFLFFPAIFCFKTERYIYTIFPCPSMYSLWRHSMYTLFRLRQRREACTACASLASQHSTSKAGSEEETRLANFVSISNSPKARREVARAKN